MNKMPNDGKGNAPKSAKGASNTGKTGGLRKASGTNQGAMEKPDTTNRYPKGLA